MLSLITALFGSKLRIFLAMAMVGIGLTLYFTYTGALKRAKAAEQALNEYKTAVQIETKRIREKNERDQAESRKVAEESQQAYLALAEKYQFNREQSKKDIQKVSFLYETRINNLSSYNNRLRQQAASRIKRMPEGNINIERFTKSWEECDTTLAEIVTACQITTADFNRCREIIDQDTKLFGRDEF